MIQHYYVGAYWLARGESAEHCALRAQTFFQHLGSCEPSWSRWHEKANSLEEALKLQVETDAASFTRMFSRRKNQQLGGGFQFHVWSGAPPKEGVTVDVACGSASSQLPSSCLLSPPSRGLVAERVLSASVMSELVKGMALAWEPEWAVATTHEHRDLLTQGTDPDTFTGWVMYFSRQRGPVPPLPAPVQVEPVEDKGTLVLLTPERFSASNPEHVALAARVHELLERAGLLGPLRPHTASR